MDRQAGEAPPASPGPGPALPDGAWPFPGPHRILSSFPGDFITQGDKGRKSVIKY